MPVPRVCNNIDVQKIIRHVRHKKRLSQVRLAKKIDLKHVTISAYETGKIQPSLEVFLKILNVGGYSLELKEDIYKTAKDLSIPTSEEEQVK